MRKALTQKNTLLKTAASQRCESKFLREYFFLQPKKKFNFFSPALRCFNFFTTAQPTTDKHLDSLLHALTGQSNLTRTTEARTGNMGFAEMAGAVVYQSFCFLLSLVLGDSDEHLSPPLRKPPNR